MSATLELLRSLPIFAALTPDELGEFAEPCERTSRESGEYILHEELWTVVRMLSGWLRSTSDSTKSFLALSML
jgi:hypothetical protein